MVEIKDIKNELSNIINDAYGGAKKKKTLKKKNPNTIKPVKPVKQHTKTPKNKNSKTLSKQVKKPIGFIWEYKNNNGEVSKKFRYIYSQ